MTKAEAEDMMRHMEAKELKDWVRSLNPRPQCSWRW